MDKWIGENGNVEHLVTEETDDTRGSVGLSQYGPWAREPWENPEPSEVSVYLYFSSCSCMLERFMEVKSLAPVPIHNSEIQFRSSFLY